MLSVIRRSHGPAARRPGLADGRRIQEGHCPGVRCVADRDPGGARGHDGRRGVREGIVKLFENGCGAVDVSGLGGER